MEKCRRLWKQYHTWIGFIVSGMLVAICYGFALQLPFFFDDLPIMAWLSHHNWVDIWTRSSENAYYRPLAFTVYQLGRLLPFGVRQITLHAVSLLVHWAGAILVMQIVKLCGKSPQQALLASTLFVVFPFAFLTIPWVTALSHPMVTALTLLAVYAALRAERDNRTRWWGVSLLATALAPLAHESGPMCSIIVGGWVFIQYGHRAGRRRIIGVALSGLLSAAAMLLRNTIPGVGRMQLAGLQDWPQNTMFFLHGLVYPVASIVGRLVLHYGRNDFMLVRLATASLCFLLIWLVVRNRDWRWVASSLWWWVCGALPAAVSLRYGDLYIAPRLYALASVGIVMLWAYLIIELGRVVRRAWGRRLVWLMLAGMIVTQNVTFLYRQRALFLTLNRAYQQVLEAARDEQNAPLGFVNVPSSLAWRDKTYAMILETVLFVPFYANLGTFIEVNEGWRASDVVTFSPVAKEIGPVTDSQGEGLDWGQMRQFAIDHRTVWLARYAGDQFVLNNVGAITANAPPASNAPLVRFEGGPVIESASAQETRDGHWAVAITWLASGPVDGDIFVHVRDTNNNLVAQIDGPALGGMIPIWLWQTGDRIYDVRHVSLPESNAPYTVQLGVYKGDGRFPAFVNDVRCPDDAAPVVTLAP